MDAHSNDPLLQVTVFRDDAAGRLALILINNSSEPGTVGVNIHGAALSGSWEGEQSTPAGYWTPLTAFTPDNPSDFQISLPATSVTSIAGKITNSRTEQEGK